MPRSSAERLRLLEPTNATPWRDEELLKMYAFGWKLVDGSENTRTASRGAVLAVAGSVLAACSMRSRKKPSAAGSGMPR